MNIMEKICKENLKGDIPNFRPGDTLKVHCKISEGDKDRIQIFEGVCIRRKRGGIHSSFTVRKISYGVGVERIFPMHSPQIDKIEVVSMGKVRRSRLYYLRELTGKAARIQRKERVVDAMEETADASEDVIEEITS
jgi:large subunit ribosomal protein L19